MFRRRGLGLALALLAPTALPAAERLVLATQEYPPYNMSDAAGKIVGISTDIVSALMAEAGYDFEIGIYPWARAIEMARTKPYTCVFSMSRTPEREASYQWIGPLVYNDWAFVCACRHETAGSAGGYAADAHWQL